MLLSKSNGEFQRLISEDLNEDNFYVPNVERTVEFDVETQLEDDEWFYINIDQDHELMINEYKDILANTVVLNEVDSESFSAIDVIFKAQEEGTIVFKKITKSKHLDNHVYITKNLMQSPKLKVIKSGINISSSIDAFYDGGNRLYFKKFSSIKSMFTNIDDYYRNATQQEIDSFKSIDLMVCSNFKFGARNTKMLAIIKDEGSIDLENEDFRKKILIEHKKYDSSFFRVEDNKFIIDSDKMLKNFLKLILGRLYQNPMTADLMEASSAKKIG